MLPYEQKEGLLICLYESESGIVYQLLARLIKCNAASSIADSSRPGYLCILI